MGILTDLFGVGLGLGLVLAVIAFIIACFLIIPFILMIVWNFVMPQMFGLPALNIWTALALWIVCGIIFGGIKVSSSN